MTELINAYYDNTRLSCYKTCPRQFYFRHIRHWRKKGTSLPLTFGLSWHAAMDIVWGLLGKADEQKVFDLAVAKFTETWIADGLPHPDDMDIEMIAKYEPRTPMIGAEMLWNYIQHRKEYIISCDEIISIEQPFAVPLQAGENCKQYYIGRIDKVVKRDGRIYPIEHKTTSMFKGRAPDHMLRPDYVEQWSHNSQVDGYLHASFMQHGKLVKSILVDAALVHKKTHDIFRFIPVERATAGLDGWVEDAVEWVDRVEADKKKLEDYRAYRIEVDHASNMPAFPKNTESCQGKYNQTCSYFDLCRYWDNPEKHDLPPEGMIIEEWNPYELHEIDKLGLK